ncbi:MAG: CRISPR-associated endonuclease Cas2 [Fibromonadales bacterium]|nr:CRISPR-associated endonuclease Cas2 [Fibromonadales bacterium]
MKHSHWFVLYDIKSGRRLRRVAKIAESFGIREQKSGFEMNMPESVVEIMIGRFERVINESEDFIAILPLCEMDYQKIERYGKCLPTDVVSEDIVVL